MPWSTVVQLALLAVAVGIGLQERADERRIWMLWPLAVIWVVIAWAVYGAVQTVARS